MCVECDPAEPESLASLGGSAPGVVDGILSHGPDGSLDLWDVLVRPTDFQGHILELLP